MSFMATENASSSVVGPVAFKDATDGEPVPVPEEKDLAVSADGTNAKLGLCSYQGTWVLEQWVPGIMAIQQSFTPRRGDVILASAPKCGTTWLKALAFATMARGAHPPAVAHTEHPLLRLNPHDCVPFMEMLFAAGQGWKMDALPSPRLMATHMHHSLLPDSITSNCKIVYICSFQRLKNLEVNTTGSPAPFANDAYFRKGEAGDWANHMTPDMAQRLDAIVEEKLCGSGFSFV